MANNNREYLLVALIQMCEKDIEWMDEDEEISKNIITASQTGTHLYHTPLKSPNTKKVKKSSALKEDIFITVVLNATQSLTREFDSQSEYVQAFK